MTRLTRRRLLLGGVPLLGRRRRPCTRSVPHTHPWDATASRGRPRAATAPTRRRAAAGGHAGFRGRADASTTPPTASTRTRSCATSTGARHAACRAAASLREWELYARRQGDRGRARREVRRLDLQRAHPRADAALPRGRAAADHVRQRLRAPAHDPLPRHPPGRDGRRARASAPGRSRPGGSTVYEFDALPAGPAPLPLPRPPAGRAHRQGPLRRVHRRPGGRPRGRRRAGDGDERVRHELRPRQRGLRRQHDRLRLHGPADRGHGATSSCGSTSSTCSSTT